MKLDKDNVFKSLLIMHLKKMLLKVEKTTASI